MFKRRIGIGMILVTLVAAFSTLFTSPNAAEQDGVFAEDTITGISWTKIANFPFSNAEAQAAMVNGKLYSFSGYNNYTHYTPTRNVLVFDPATQVWSYLAPLTSGVTHAGITTDGTDIYFAGGYIEKPGGGQIFGTTAVWRYNVGANNYTAFPALPETRAGGQLALVGSVLHFIGGTNLARTVDVGDHYALDLTHLNPDGTLKPGMSGWETLASVPNPRHHAASFVLDGKIYYVGGQHKHDGALVAQTDVHRYDPITDDWDEMTDLPEGRNHIGSSSVLLNRRFYVFSGQVNSGQKRNTVLVYDVDANTWTNLISGALPFTRDSSVVGFLNGMFYYSQGYTNEQWVGVPTFSSSTPTHTSTKTATHTPTNTHTATHTSTSTPTKTATPTNTPTATYTNTATNTPTPTPTSTFTPDPDAPIEKVVNGGFEETRLANNRLPTVWTVKRTEADRVRCDQVDENAVVVVKYAHTGSCAFRFKGQTERQAGNLTQMLDIADITIGDTLTLSAYFKGGGVNGNNRVVALIALTGGDKVTLRSTSPKGTFDYAVVSDVYTVSKALKRIKVRVIFVGKKGQLYVDDVSLAVTKAESGSLEAPDEPVDLRGN